MHYDDENRVKCVVLSLCIIGSTNEFATNDLVLEEKEEE